MIGIGKEKDDLRWMEQFKKLQVIRNLNPDRWPTKNGEEDEKQLCNWCQSQRQAQAGTHSGGRKHKLKGWRVDRLNSIGFNWSQKETHNKSWNEHFRRVKEYLQNNELGSIKAQIDGKYNPMYAWLNRQKVNYRKGHSNETKIKRLRSIGIDIKK